MTGDGGAEPIGRGDYGRFVRDHLEGVEAQNRSTLDRVAARMFDVVRGDHLIYTAGTGHSLALVLETFYRAGGLACVQPVYHASLLPLHGALESTHCEKTAGLGDLLVSHFVPTEHDLALVCSHSGANAVPVEMAEAFRARGTPVVAVVSLTHLHAAPAPSGSTLAGVADDVLDTMVPYGDAAFPAGEGLATAALSSITGIFLWNLLLTRLAELAASAGERLPMWVSSNVEGGRARNQELLARYQRRVPSL
jgi:uncharacterized phosphosugar-binding protein